MKKSYGFVLVEIVVGKTPKQRYWEKVLMMENLKDTLTKNCTIANIKHSN